ncbi:helix-turn-helix domain-containing protein [Nocardiopsis sp. LOL_012]|uniref:helix-turn-helix domain-containing protein n=1 Tax=Nocardiopsis sp. LOL_012 TaxID=3345409 RepID=UPI003A8751DE
MPSRTSLPESAAIAQFGNELRRLRNLSDMSQKDLGQATGTSKQQVGAIERGDRRPSKQFAELADKALEAHNALLNLWPGAKQAQPWWLEKFVELEAKAQVINEFQAQAIPGLLQTEGYAKAVMGAAFPPPSRRSIEDLLKARLDRQKILRRDRPPLALFVVDEGALRRTAGGKSVMREQYKALIEAAEWPFVQIQVLPFDRGAHAAMEGSLVLLTMTHAESLVYAETPGSGQVITDARIVADCHQQFGALRSLALSPAESLDFIASL